MNLDAVVIVITLGLVATACGFVGPFLVVRRSALIADALGHAVLPGLVAAYLVGGWRLLPVRLGAAMVVAVGCALAIEAVARRRLVAHDAAIALVFPALFALGVVGVTVFADGVHLDLDAAIYGDITFAPLRTVADTAMPVSIVSTGLAVVVAAAVAFLVRRPLLADTVDPVGAQVAGLGGAAAARILLSAVAVIAVLVFESIGAVLLVAYLIVPAVLGQRVARTMAGAVGIAIGTGWVAAVVGYTAAVTFDTSVTGAVGLANVGLFSLVVAALAVVAALKRSRHTPVTARQKLGSVDGSDLQVGGGL